MRYLILLLLTSSLLTGCSSTQIDQNESPEEVQRFDGIDGITDSRVITDKETGCKYLFVKRKNSGGVTPLYNGNGELYCNK